MVYVCANTHDKLGNGIIGNIGKAILAEIGECQVGCMSNVKRLEMVIESNLP